MFEQKEQQVLGNKVRRVIIQGGFWLIRKETKQKIFRVWRRGYTVLSRCREPVIKRPQWWSISIYTYTAVWILVYTVTPIYSIQPILERRWLTKANNRLSITATYYIAWLPLMARSTCTSCICIHLYIYRERDRHTHRRGRHCIYTNSTVMPPREIGNRLNWMFVHIRPPPLYFRESIFLASAYTFIADAKITQLQF